MVAQTVTESIDGALYRQFENGLVLHIVLGAIDRSRCPRRNVDQCVFPF